MSNTTVILSGLILSVIGALTIYIHRSRLNLLHLYVFIVCEYFGILSAVDGVLNQLTNYDSLYIAFVHGIVGFSVVVLMLFYKTGVTRKYFEVFSIRYLLELSDRIPLRTVRYLSGVLLVVHIVIYYSILTEINTIKLEEGNEEVLLSLPYWATSIWALYRSLFFVAAIISFLVVFKSIRSRSLLSALDIAAWLTIVMSLSQFGRTYAFNAVFLCLVLFVFGRAKKIQFYKLTLYAFLVVTGLVLFSNYHQTYRDGKNPGMDPVSAMTNFEATVYNLNIRMPMWRFNYMIAESRWNSSKGPDFPGLHILTISSAAIPSILLPGIEKVIGDDLIARTYDIPKNDYPSNDYATYFADFGILSVLLVPLQILFVFAVFFKIFAALAKRHPLNAIFISCLLWKYLSFVETEIVALPLLFRDTLLFLVLFWMASTLNVALRLNSKRLTE